MQIINKNKIINLMIKNKKMIIFKNKKIDFKKTIKQYNNKLIRILNKISFKMIIIFQNFKFLIILKIVNQNNKIRVKKSNVFLSIIMKNNNTRIHN